VDQIDRTYVEGRRHADLAAEVEHPLGEIETRPPMVETSVDMRRLDVEEGAGVDRFGESDEEPHGESRAPAVLAGQEFAIEGRKVEGH
jgi:hypothetical protein